MNRIISGLQVLLFIILFAFVGCDDSETDEVSSVIPQELTTLIHSGSLLKTVDQQGELYTLIFEDTTFVLSDITIDKIVCNKSEWNTTVFYKDGKELAIPTLGDNLDNVVKKTTVNPTGYCPLAVEFQLSFPVPGRVKVIVEGKNGSEGDLEHLFPLNSANQLITVFGLYPDYKNNLTLIFTDNAGNERLRTTQQIETAPLDNLYLLTIDVEKAIPEKMEKGLTFIAYLGANEFDTFCPFMVDCEGEVRWTLTLKPHPQIGNIQTHTGFKRLRNGNFLCGNIKTSSILEIDMLGSVKNAWELRPLGYEFHHEVTEMPNGNFLILVSGHSSVDESGNSTVSDMVLELNRETGAIRNIWDLKKSLDEKRKVAVDENEWDPQDWAHDNAITYSPDDDCIIVSARHQGLIKLDRNNQVKWILAPHKGWENKGLSGKLLDPLDASGNKIIDDKIKKGEARHADFDWSWGGHNPSLLDDGSILIFDNGYYRQYNSGNINDVPDSWMYSRSVIYKIDENKRTVRQAWQYGEERGRECWAIAISSTQYLPERKHILFCPGVGTISAKGLGGKVVEVDMETREVVFEANFVSPTVWVFHRAVRMPLYP